MRKEEKITIPDHLMLSHKVPKGGTMNITITAAELQDLGIWAEACEELGINPYAVNEGLMNPDEELTLTEFQAQRLKLI